MSNCLLRCYRQIGWWTPSWTVPVTRPGFEVNIYHFFRGPFPLFCRVRKSIHGAVTTIITYPGKLECWRRNPLKHGRSGEPNPRHPLGTRNFTTSTGWFSLRTSNSQQAQCSELGVASPAVVVNMVLLAGRYSLRAARYRNFSRVLHQISPSPWRPRNTAKSSLCSVALLCPQNGLIY